MAPSATTTNTAGTSRSLPSFLTRAGGSSSSSSTLYGPYSLFLLEGLSHRNRTAAIAIVEEAFHQWNSMKILSRLFQKLRLRIKKNKQQQQQQQQQQQKQKEEQKGNEDSASSLKISKNKKGSSNVRSAPKSLVVSSSSSSSFSKKNGLYHWLFQGLQSPSLPERQVACKILARGLCVSDPHRQWQVLELIVDLLKLECDNDGNRSGSRNRSSSSSNNNNVCNTTLIALWKHLVTRVVSPGTALAVAIHKDMGIPWLCRWVYRQQQEQKRRNSTNMMTSVASSSSFSTSNGNSGENTHSSYAVLPLLDLLYALVMVSRDAAYLHRAHLFLWRKEQDKTKPADGSGGPNANTNTNNNSKAVVNITLGSPDTQQHQQHEQILSPLACLIGAKHYASDNYNSHNNKAILDLLQPLVDPEAVPKLLPDVPLASSTTSSKKKSKGETYLMDTFAAPKSSSTSTAEEAGSSISDSRVTSPLAAAAASLESALPSAASTVAQLFSAVYNSAAGEEDRNNQQQQQQDSHDDQGTHHHHDHHLMDEDEEEEDDNDMEDDDDDDDDHFDVEDDDHHGHHHDDGDDDDEDHDHDEEHDDDDEGHAEEEEEEDVHQEEDEDKAKSNPNRMDVDQDEEIDSEEGEDVKEEEDDDDDDDEDDDDDDEDDDDDDEEEVEDHGIVIHDEDVARLEQGLLELNEIGARGAASNAASSAAAAIAARIQNAAAPSSAPAAPASAPLLAAEHPQTVEERKQIYVRACMQVIYAQHPPASKLAQPQQNQSQAIVATAAQPASTLSLQSEHALMTSILNIVQPPKKPVNLKFILRRAPTQEEFFRGSLSKNPVTLSMLKASGGQEPTVRDLRQHIATDLQMADSAEMLELLVTNKILDVDLKLRVVQQVVWKNHLIQHAPSSSAASNALSSFLGGRGGARPFISTGSGLSMIFNSGLDRSLAVAAGGAAITADTPLSALPPMIVTYRLTGVDGEATEDTISTLEDPDAPSETATPEQVEEMMEKKFGITRLVTNDRGVGALLRTVERHINDTLRRIRRDGVGLKGGENPSRNQFKQSSPCAGLTLLTCCAKLPSNRRLLLQTRAPTILLRLLLDVLHALEEDNTGNQKSESNSTAQSLQELIEVLASDMLSSGETAQAAAPAVQNDDNTEHDTSTLRLLLQAIETSSLSGPLRNVIAKLLPYLTYGQAALSKELAAEFVKHVKMDRLGDCENEDSFEQMTDESKFVLMATFVHASISLRPNEVCNSLRKELLSCGFVQGIARFLLQGIPEEPPTWSAPLWSRGEQHEVTSNAKRKENLEHEWKDYMERRGLKTAFNMLIGLSRQHGPTQECLGTFVGSSKKYVPLIRACHWIEATSDNTSARISMNGLGLVAETLLDELAADNSPVANQVKSIRRKTRDRKKEIAMERRSKALVSMSNFGPLAGTTVLEANKGLASSPSSSVRDAVASIVAPVWDLFQSSSSSQGDAANPSSPSQPPAKRRKKNSDKKKQQKASPPAKPAWMMEMENMEDETGLTCAVCQEGRTLQPSEILGLYAYVKKITVPLSQGGGRNNIDGTTLLVALPSTVPDSISGTHAGDVWFPAAMPAKEDLSNSSRTSLSSSVASSRRSTYFTTTVSAGNAIHFSCHTKARQADRNHPKAPKSEWEGASLRNSRVNCNVILPLVSSRSSKVPLVAVDVALTDHQTAVSNLLGARPKSMLWTVLHDVRFLLLRMAYGEALNSDCGGGSLHSNAQLVFYQLLMADMFEKDAQLDAPETSQHVRGLSAGFLAANAIVQANDGSASDSSINNLVRGISDAAPMAALTAVVFFNNKDDYARAATSSEDEAPHPKRRWIVGKDSFLRGLLNCAGRRHALGVTDSGCTTGRSGSNKRSRSGSAFADWDIVDEDDILMDLSGGGNTSSALSPERAAALKRSNSKAGIDDFRDALRPMLVYFAMMDQLSTDFVLNMDDLKVEEYANNLVQVIGDCRRAKSIQELLSKAKVTLGEDEIIEELQKGMMSA